MDREALARMARECGFAKLGVCGVEPFADARERVASQPPLSERRQLRFDPALECPWATALLVMLECMLPFFMVFEGRKPQA